MVINTYYCDFCKNEVKEKQLNGFGAEIVCSLNGWGRRQEIIDGTYEICNDCFSKVNIKSHELKSLIKSLKK